MEEKINIAEILKDKKEGIRLYSPIFGECTFCYVREDTNDICVKKHNGVIEYFNYEGLYFALGEVMLFPSKEMRDWEKFALKKGDALSCGVDNLCIFEKWANEEYTEFYAKFVTPNYSGNTFKTEKLSKETNEAVIKQYISNIEEFKGGKLNLTTLEIEKTQPEFKDGDVLFVKCNDSAFIEIFEYSKKNGDLCDHASLDITNQILDISGKYIILKDEITELRLATEEEKQQLFDALAKEGKRWDAEKKMIVYLKPKVELKPFDKVVVRCSEADRWSIDFFSYKVHNGYICTGDAWFGYCLPYNDETSHLLGTTDEWKGGEG